jgi:hypothetical protein
MQTVYATHLNLPDALGAAALDVAAEVLLTWVGTRFGVALYPLSGGEAHESGVDVRWESLFGDSRGLIATTVDQPDRNDAGSRWRTYIDLGVDEGRAWLRARVQLSSPFEGRLTSPKVQAGRPGIVRALTDAMDIRIDDWELGEWPVERHQVPAYVGFLDSPDRQLPIDALSVPEGGEPFLDPSRASDRLLGLAHVVVVDSQASYAVTDMVGKALSCFSGAVRIYWPGFNSQDDPYFHRL